MHIDFGHLNKFLLQQPGLTYPIRQRLFHGDDLHWTKLWFTGQALLLQDWALHLYGDEQQLYSLLKELPPGKYEFFATAEEYMPLLQKVFQGIETETLSDIYVLKEDDFPRDQVESLDNLTEEDVDLVDANWDYRFDGSRDFFLNAITSYPSSAIRIDDKLAGWAVCYSATDDMANLGSLRVLQPWLRQGWGRKIALDLAAKVLDSGRTPMVQILTTNTASQNLSCSIGFKALGQHIFWGEGTKP